MTEYNASYLNIDIEENLTSENFSTEVEKDSDWIANIIKTFDCPVLMKLIKYCKCEDLELLIRECKFIMKKDFQNIQGQNKVNAFFY